ncbi:MAG: cellulase family glycosylhydrolase [Actinobacteria bacterium]|nr:cellulase family glycosylhydrolase [Actinomycetota bacterium]
MRRIMNLVLVMGMVAVLVGPLAGEPALAAALTSNDFLKADGSVLRNGNGTGDIVNLRGTNLGGWLTFEDWMSPLGEFALDRSDWSATSSAGTASNMLDGDLTTRMSSGATQSGSEWAQLDLGVPTLMNRILIDAGSWTTGWPAEYEVLVSDDASTWRSVARADGTPPATVTSEITTTRFAPQIARYVRVKQLGAKSQYWSIAEINLFSDPVLHNGSSSASASVTAWYTTPGAGIDGDITSAWTTGTDQVPGQTYTLDLGSAMAVNKVLFDSGSDYPNDYPATYEISASTDGTSWTKVGSGYGTNRITTEDFWTSTWMRYLRITQTGSKSNWWAISEVAVTTSNSFDRTGWTLSSSPSGTTANMVDDDLSTRWTTNAPQANGQYVQVDFGAQVTFNNVVMDTQKNTSSETDYPRNYTVAVSDNGTSWTTVATETGTFKATTVNFPAASGRYLKITQTGASGSWWSIGELNVALNNDDYSLRLDLDDRFGATTAQSIIDTHRDTWIVESDLDNISNMGLNVIRLPIGWNELLNLDGTWKADPWTKIDWLIQKAGERGIYVLLDLHTLPGGGCPWGSCGRAGPNPNGFWGNSTYQDWVVDIWEKIAARYDGNPVVAGYDLINEPLLDYGEDSADVTQKSDYYDRLYDAVRAIDADHAIFIAAFFGWDKIADPSTYNWTNVVYELHPYDMPNGRDWNAQNAVVTAQLVDLGSKLSNPGVPVLYGEYSFYYFDDVWARFMAGLNALDVSWTSWTYKVRGSRQNGFGYWGFYNTNLNQVPIINSDDAATFKGRLENFSTVDFLANEPFIATVSRYADGTGTFSPTALNRIGWSASASVTEAGSSAANAIDGTASTRWSTGTAQTAGQWFQVDMGSNQSIGQVTIETRSSDKWDYPNQFKVETSTDGTTWTQVADGPGFGWKRPISFDGVTVRYVRITQTGAAPEWWTIGELNIYAAP